MNLTDQISNLLVKLPPRVLEKDFDGIILIAVGTNSDGSKYRATQVEGLNFQEVQDAGKALEKRGKEMETPTPDDIATFLKKLMASTSDCDCPRCAAKRQKISSEFMETARKTGFIKTDQAKISRPQADLYIKAMAARKQGMTLDQFLDLMLEQ